jgi:hypothetical protein
MEKLIEFKHGNNTTISLPYAIPHYNTNSVRVSVEEVGDTIEMIYKEFSNVHYYTNPPTLPSVKVYKIVYSCKDGKWHKSDRIYGEIIPAQNETYKF